MTLLALLIFIAANIADVLTTLALLKRGGYERNPIYGKHPSAARLLAIKAASVAVVGFVLWRYPSMWPVGLGLAVVIAVVAFNNHRLMR
jgi:hypothetical protein